MEKTINNIYWEVEYTSASGRSLTREFYTEESLIAFLKETQLDIDEVNEVTEFSDHTTGYKLYEDYSW